MTAFLMMCVSMNSGRQPSLLGIICIMLPRRLHIATAVMGHRRSNRNLLHYFVARIVEKINMILRCFNDFVGSLLTLIESPDDIVTKIASYSYSLILEREGKLFFS